MSVDKTAGKRLLVLGGIAQLCDVIFDAQKMGIRVIVADNVLDSPAKQIADERYDISVTNVDELVTLCQTSKVDGVMNYCIDPSQKPYVKICNNLGLPCYGTQEQFDVLTNKDNFKRACNDSGVLTIKSFDFDDHDIEYPVVVKPADGRASKGMSICHDESELQDSIDLALEHSQRKAVCIEKRMQGPEVCAKYFVADGKVSLVAFSDTLTTVLNGERIYISGKRYPSRYFSEFSQRADGALRRLIRNLGILNGPLSFTGFYDDGEFRFFDPSFRLGGGQEWVTIRAITGVDLSNRLTRFAVTGSMGDSSEIAAIDCGFARRAALTLQVLVGPGCIGSIRGLDGALKLNFLAGYHVCHGVGKDIQSVGTSENVFMRVMLVGDQIEDLVRDAESIYSKLSVDDSSGRSMVIPFDLKEKVL